MTQTARRFAPAPGGWASIGFIYLYGVLSAASLSKVIPVLGDIAAHLRASPAQLAWVVSLMAVLPALLASVAGTLIDRIGAHRALQGVALVGLAVNAAYLAAPSLDLFLAVRVMEGLVAAGAYSAAPALIMATTAGPRRSRAMAVWSTYTPAGFSLGLLMGGAFAGTAQWRGGYVVHFVLFAALLALSWTLPRAPAAPLPAMPSAGLLAVWRRPGPLGVALTFAVLVLQGFGMGNVYPQWYAHQHGVTAGEASGLLGTINLAMIPGGFLAGALLARGWRDTRLFTVLLALTAVLAWPLYMPGVPGPLRFATLLAWMLVQGAAIAVVVAALPRVVSTPVQGAAAAGLLSQLAAVMTFLTPLIWQPLLHAGQWQGFIAITVASALAGCLLFPSRR